MASIWSIGNSRLSGPSSFPRTASGVCWAPCVPGASLLLTAGKHIQPQEWICTGLHHFLPIKQKKRCSDIWRKSLKDVYSSIKRERTVGNEIQGWINDQFITLKLTKAPASNSIIKLTYLTATYIVYLKNTTT